MPEGDTIHAIAAYLAPRLAGRTLRAGSLRDEPGLELGGLRVRAVRAHGKHLFLDLDDGRVLRSHLGMHGSWHRYAPGERWRAPRREASIVLETEGDVLVCFRAREVSLLEASSLARRDLERRLGPDLAAGVPSAQELAELVARARLRPAPQALVQDVLLDQTVAGGIGNVYKSELLFLERLDPCTPLAAVPDATLAALFARAAALLAANVPRARRTTRSAPDDEGRLWVYRRAGEPCLVCAGPVRGARQGRRRRSTYWCARCQGAPA